MPKPQFCPVCGGHEVTVQSVEDDDPAYEAFAVDCDVCDWSGEVRTDLTVA